MAKTRAQLNRKIRQDELRRQLAEQCRVQHVLDTIKKIEELDTKQETFSYELAKLKTANEQRLKLIDKYLPNPKQIEIVDGTAVEDEIANLTDEELEKIASLER